MHAGASADKAVTLGASESRVLLCYVLYVHQLERPALYNVLVFHVYVVHQMSLFVVFTLVISIMFIHLKMPRVFWQARIHIKMHKTGTFDAIVNILYSFDA